MEKRTVWFGIPVIVVVLSRNFLGMVALYVVGMMVYVGLVGTDVVPIEWLMNPIHLVLVLVLPVIALNVLMIRFVLRIVSFKKRLVAHRGRMCFVCGYEIGDGLERCSECGARWSLDDLSTRWRKMAEGEEGKE